MNLKSGGDNPPGRGYIRRSARFDETEDFRRGLVIEVRRPTDAFQSSITNLKSEIRQRRSRVGTTPAHNRLRILFVDDEAHLREFMRTELPRLGHEVTVCPDSKTGIEAVKKGVFDAAIL